MVRKVRFKRGNSSQNDNYIGDSGEITVDLENKNIRLHDGIKAGGFLSLSYEQFRSLIAQDFLNHSISNDHDGLYYRKEEVDQLLQNLGGGSSTIDAQDSVIMINDNFGWKLQKGEIEINRSGYWHHPNSPSWTTLGNGIFCHTFESNQRKEFWSTFIVDHDYAEGTKIYPFINWSKANGAAGNVRWGFEYAVAKSYNQGDHSSFSSSSLVYVTSNVPNSNNRHNFTSELSEVQAIPATRLEPGSVIRIRCFRDGFNDSYGHNIFLTGFGIKYQIKRLATKNRNPFYFD